LIANIEVTDVREFEEYRQKVARLIAQFGGRYSGRQRRTIIVSGATQTTPDWSAWSQESVRLMQERNDAWIRHYGLEGRRYQWSLDEARLRFTSESDEVTCDICVIGSVSRSEGTFCWAWANEAIPSCAWRGLASVRDFGETHVLELLISPQWPGSRPEGLEMAADRAAIWAPGLLRRAGLLPAVITT